METIIPGCRALDAALPSSSPTQLRLDSAVAIFQHYNLACYECLLGDVEVAKARLQHAFKLEPRYRLQALEDEDLKGGWHEQFE